MIRAHVDRNQPQETLSLYKQMLSSDFSPNNYTFSFLLRSCLYFFSLTEGLKFHAQIVKLGWEPYDFVQNGLIHMYSSCGGIDFARRLFDGSSNITTENASKGKGKGDDEVKQVERNTS